MSRVGTRKRCSGSQRRVRRTTLSSVGPWLGILEPTSALVVSSDTEQLRNGGSGVDVDFFAACWRSAERNSKRILMATLLTRGCVQYQTKIRQQTVGKRSTRVGHQLQQEAALEPSCLLNSFEEPLVTVTFVRALGPAVCGQRPRLARFRTRRAATSTTLHAPHFSRRWQSPAAARGGGRAHHGAA
eukprot:953450-Pleurochrysis_carterae.AAC.1